SPGFLSLIESFGIQVRQNRISKKRTNLFTADMALTQRLEIRQSHALVMTPQLMQAIKLLQLSHLDLAAYVDGELEKNPLLERAAGDETVRGDGGADHENGHEASLEGSLDASRGDDEHRNGDW